MFGSVGQKVMFACCGWWISIHLVGFCIFYGLPVVIIIIIIDSSKTQKSLDGVEVQSQYFIERCSNQGLALIGL